MEYETARDRDGLKRDDDRLKRLTSTVAARYHVKYMTVHIDFSFAVFSVSKS
jgi:hypothetical protein